MISQYKIDGKVLILPITGSGGSNLTLGEVTRSHDLLRNSNFTINILFSAKDNVDIKLKFAPTITEKNGKQYIRLANNKFKLAFDTSRLYLQLENLFNGNKALGDNMNLFLNENWQIILQELKPAVRETLAQIIGGIINNVFDKVSYSDIFLDDDANVE